MFATCLGSLEIVTVNRKNRAHKKSVESHFDEPWKCLICLAKTSSRAFFYSSLFAEWFFAKFFWSASPTRGFSIRIPLMELDLPAPLSHPPSHKSDSDLQQTHLALRWFCWTSKPDLSSTTVQCDQNHFSHICKLVTPKARAKHEHLFNEPASVNFIASERLRE